MFSIGLFIHVVFLFSIFDIYFKSPIVRNVEPYQPQHEALADRLVLFVVDGLRAESFVNYTTMEYLRTVASTHGRWGISNTRVPTESRPGHVAVIAGFYEDPSAVAKGWKENPVDFDSFFNQTRYTWCWGTYDIVDIFTKGLVDDHITVNTFDPYDQTFSSDKNTTQLDSWVFENVKSFFIRAKNDNYLKEKLYQNKISFFLHLLGTDTSGHTHKPKTSQFLDTVRFVDQGIQEIEKIIRDFYGDDGKTAFLMTSDHGMTDWGSHGAGDEHETQTPYVLWGAGVHHVPSSEKEPNTEGLPLNRRFDINQADLTPLMSTILSVPVPVNSIGQLTPELLEMTQENKAKAIYSNSRQLASQYNTKRMDVENNAISALYQPFDQFDKKKYEEVIQYTETMLSEEKFEQLIILSEMIMHLSLSGLTYYHNYYQRPLLILVTLSFVGWIMCMMKMLLIQNINTQTDPSSHMRSNVLKFGSTTKMIINTIFILLIMVASSLVYAQNLPIQYYTYFCLPLILWWYALTPHQLWVHALRHLKKKRQTGTFLLEILCYSLGSLAMGLSFTYRWMLSIPLLGMALWPFFSTARKQLNMPILLSWASSCVLLSGFTFVPVVGKQVFIELVILAGVVWLMAFIVYLMIILTPLYERGTETKKEIVLTVLHVVLLAVSLHNIYIQSRRFEMGTPVSNVHQMIAWMIASISIVLPLMHSTRIVSRLSSIYTSMLTFYLLLSVSHEGLFLVTLCVNLLCWMMIEFKLTCLVNADIIECTFECEDNENPSKTVTSSISTVERNVSHQDFRRAFFFLLYIIVAFFGTGNIASLNSFEVRWVTCFITSFHPFLITGLILLKTLAPFLCVACCFRAVQRLTKAPTGYLNVIVMIYSNIMGIQVLYYVKNTGSWLEIGTSISQFVIVQVITLFIVLIHQMAKVFTDVNIYVAAHNMLKVRKKYE